MPVPVMDILDVNLGQPAKIKLGISVRSGTVPLDQCKFNVYIVKDEKDKTQDELHKSVSPQVTGNSSSQQTGTADVELPKVADDEPNYCVRWTVDYKGTEIPQTEQWIVWPAALKIVAKTDDGSKPFSNVPFDISQRSQTSQEAARSTYATNGEGVVDNIPLKPEAFSIALPRGFEDQKKDPGKGRVREYHLKHTFEAEFVSPSAPTNPTEIKQWVNLDPDSKLPQNGHTVKVTVGAKEMKGNRGDVIYIQAKFGMESKRSNPQPELKGAADITSSTEGTATVYKGKVTLGDKGAPASFTLELGVAGKDTCEVKIGATDACQDATIKFENRRKIYYQVTRPDSLAAPDMTLATNALKEVGIDIEEYTVDGATLPENTPANAWFDASMFESGKTGKALVIGTHNIGAFKGKFRKLKSPALHVILCHHQLDADSEMDQTITFDANDKVKWPPGSGTDVPGWRMPASQTGNGNALFFPKDLRNGTDAVKGITWKCREDVSKSGSIPKDHIVIDQATHGNYVHIKLPDDAAALINSGKTLSVRVRVAYAEGWYNGWCTGTGRHNVVKAGRPDRDINGTIVHELGHALNQSANNASLFPGLTAPPHDRYYTNNRGHQGNHCANGIDEATYTDVSKKLDTSDAGGKCTCIMYGAGTDLRNSNIAFCSKCQPYAIAVEITEVSTP